MGESKKQEEINQLLYKYASEGKTVVRLKGGDPYVFGRGEEECAYLVEKGICCEVVPGVSSAFAVPAYAGIPVTSRWMSSGVTVLTAVRSTGEVIDLDYVPKKGTLVILMGVHVADRLKEQLLKVRPAGEPVAVIENGTLPGQRVFVSTLEKLDVVVRENKVRAPAIFIVGEVVKLRSALTR
ncbi:uroporphyrinogen-III C-methyltransferase [Sulfodiicoccus acidiphilus]|nr:uroporphyrinogen-III C-methyltransferase [Sulfodiicoccus acidiphilus]